MAANSRSARSKLSLRSVLVIVIGLIVIVVIGIQYQSVRTTQGDERQLEQSGTALDSIKAQTDDQLQTVSSFRNEQCYSVDKDIRCTQILSMSGFELSDSQLEAAVRILTQQLDQSSYFTQPELNLTFNQAGAFESDTTLKITEASTNTCTLVMSAYANTAEQIDARGSFNAEVSCTQESVPRAIYPLVN